VRQIKATDIDGLAVTIGPGLVGLFWWCFPTQRQWLLRCTSPWSGEITSRGKSTRWLLTIPGRTPAPGADCLGWSYKTVLVPSPGNTRGLLVHAMMQPAKRLIRGRCPVLVIPEGRSFERLAREGNPQAVRFAVPRMVMVCLILVSVVSRPRLRNTSGKAIANRAERRNHLREQ